MPSLCSKSYHSVRKIQRVEPWESGRRTYQKRDCQHDLVRANGGVTEDTVWNASADSRHMGAVVVIVKRKFKKLMRKTTG